MKICRFESPDGHRHWGVWEQSGIQVLASAPFEEIRKTGEVVALAEARLLAPSTPSKIVAIGLNYRAHADEMKKPLPAQPLLFIKPSTAVLDPELPIRLPEESREVHFEGELALVIGHAARRVTPEEARRCVLGFTCLNDVTARDIQRAEVQYTRAKGFDTFAPFGPWVETDLNPAALAVTTRVNGQVKQQGNTNDMIFDPFELVAFISRGMTLLPGDVITTGTPPGVGSLAAGDRVEVEIQGIGTLRNRVERE